MSIWKSKTFWTAIAGICTAAAGYCTGEIGLPALIAAVFAGLATIFARQGIEKSRYPGHEDRGERLE